MLRTMREGSEKHPWILWLILIAIAITFVIVGAWDYDGSAPNTVAKVGPYKVTLQEYRRAKQRYARFYRDQLKQDDVKDETIQQLALDGLITNKSWRVLADQFGLAVSPEELADSIVNLDDFKKDGVFDPQYYQRLLAANRMKPNEYEKQRRGELLIEKAQLLVSEVTTLTPAELQEVKDLNDRQTLEGAEPDMKAFEQTKMQFLLQKKQRSLQAFQAELRARGDITIHRELL